jgi:type IV pilus assembly protein PilY1
MSMLKRFVHKSLAASLAVLTAAQPAFGQGVVDLASAPLASRTQAIPNLIFGVDDSGSMDLEMMFDSSDGVLWYENSSRTFWNGAGVLHQNPTRSLALFTPYEYLFPNGASNGSGGWNSDRRRYGDSTGYYAVPPIPAYGFTRSSAYNPLYYNPAIRYRPWPPGYVTHDVTGAAIAATALTFGNASPTAARSHPFYPSSGGATTFNLTATLSSTATDWTFRFMPNMVIPGGIGAQRKCDGASSWTNVTSNYTVPGGSVCDAHVPYYPATYWYADSSCNPSTDAVNCGLAPNGTRLRKREIRSTTPTYPKVAARTDCAGASCTYAEEIQNFANWFQYYRKRRLMMAAGMGQALTDIRGIRGGSGFFNRRAAGENVTMYDFSAASASANGQMVLGRMYISDAYSATPTRATLRWIGEQYQRTDAGAPIEFGCQRNNAFIVTDGFNTDFTTTAPAYTRSTWNSAAPWTTIHNNNLHDIAGALYTNNPRTDLPAGLLSIDPTYSGSNPDRNTNLHVNTHAITLGALGNIYGRGTPSANNPFLNPPAWAASSGAANPTEIDDLWHATIVGRGSMYTARNANELTTSINNVVRNMLVASGSDAGIAVSSVNIRAGNNTAYVSSYNAQDWSGELCAYPVNTTTGAIDTTAATALWCTRDQLTAMTSASRKIASYDGSSGVRFASSGGQRLPNALVDGLALSVTDGANVLAYLRGDRSLEGSTYRTRTALLGDITTAEPVYDQPASGNAVVYQAANDGMLHAFDAVTGAELWAYVPYNILGTIKELARPTYTHRYFVDGTPTVQDIVTRKVLVGGLRGGGAGFYAIDVSDPRPNSETALANNVLWEFPNAATSAAVRNQIGTSYGKPLVVKLADGTWVALVTSGYNNASGQNHVHVLNATTGALLQTITTPSGAGLAQLSAWVADPSADPIVDYVYGGDLSGNLWRFDLRGAAGTWTAARLAQFVVGGVAQPITSAPELTQVGSRRLIVVGTGRLLGTSDVAAGGTQSVYGVLDDQSATPEIASPRTALFQQTLTTGAGGIRNLTSNAIDWGLYKGWFFDLPSSERITTDPSLAFGVLTFTSNAPSATACSSTSYLYAVNVETGGQMPSTNFGSGTPWAGRQLGYTYSSRPVVITLPSGRVVAITHKSDATIASSDLPIVAGGKLRRVAWREVQR